MISPGVLMTVYLHFHSRLAHRPLVGGGGKRLEIGAEENLQLDDMRMPQQLEILYLALDTTLHVAADQLLPGDDLERDLLASAPMHGELDFAEAAFAQGLYDVVCSDTLLGASLLPKRRPGCHLAGSHRRHGVVVVGGAAAVAAAVILVAADLRRRERDGELLVVVSSVSHDGGWGLRVYSQIADGGDGRCGVGWEELQWGVVAEEGKLSAASKLSSQSQ